MATENLGMTMDKFDSQLEQLRLEGIRTERWKSVITHSQSNGSVLIQLTEYKLPDLWNLKFTDVYFKVPVGYPFDCPDSFWTPELRCKSGGCPITTAKAGFVSGTDIKIPDLMWWMQRVNTWNPNRDSLLTFVHVIHRRLSVGR